MDQYIDAFLRWLGDISPHTRRTYTNDLKHFSRWHADRNGRPAALDALKPMTVVLYKAALIDRLQLKPATIKRRLSTLHRFGQWAAAEGLIDSIPTQNMKIPQVAREKPAAMDPADVERLLLAAQLDPHVLARRNYAILRLLVDAGLRVGAVVGLKLADITRAKDGKPDSITVRSGKRPVHIPLAQQTRDALAAYLDARPDAADDRVFVSTHGAGMSTETVRHLVNKYARLAGLNPRDVSPRLLRKRGD